MEPAGVFARLAVCHDDRIDCPAAGAGPQVDPRLVLDELPDRRAVADLNAGRRGGLDEREVEPAARDHRDRGRGIRKAEWR